MESPYSFKSSPYEILQRQQQQQQKLPSIQLSKDLIDILPVPLLVFTTSIDHNEFITPKHHDDHDIVFNGYANSNLSSLLAIGSRGIVDSIIRVQTPNCSPILKSMDHPTNTTTTASTKLSSSSPSPSPSSPTVSSSSSLRNSPPLSPILLSSNNQNSSIPPSTINTYWNSLQHPDKYNNEYILNNIDSIISIDTSKQHTTTTASTTNSRPLSILECIQLSFHEQREIIEPVVLNNTKEHCSYSSKMTISPFNDGCCCAFTDVLKMNTIKNNQQQPQPTTTNKEEEQQQLQQQQLYKLQQQQHQQLQQLLQIQHDQEHLQHDQILDLQNQQHYHHNQILDLQYQQQQQQKQLLKLQQQKQQEKYDQHLRVAMVFELFENLNYLFTETPIIIWRANTKGEMIYFTKMNDIDFQGRSLDEFLKWVHPSNHQDFVTKFKSTIDGQSEQEKFDHSLWLLNDEKVKDYLLFKVKGFKVRDTSFKYTTTTTATTATTTNQQPSKTNNNNNNDFCWIGVAYSYVMNEGALLALKTEINLHSMYNRFKTLYSMDLSDRCKLNVDDFPVNESYQHFIKEKKISMSEDDHKIFQKCRDTYNVLFRLSLLGVMFSTLGGIILDANDALLSTLGYTRQDLEEGKVDWMVMTPPEYYDISARALQELKSKRWCQPIEKAYFGKNGKKIQVLVSCVMVDGSFDQCITFVFDLSRYRQAEESAIQANKLKSQFIANISHELRTPCHGILGMTDFLLDSKLTPAQREQAETIKDSTDKLISLIDDILDFSKIESEKMTLDYSSFELVPMVEHVISEQSKLSNSKAIDLIFIMGREYPVPPVLFGDLKRIKQVLSNLVSNAVKFTTNGFVLIEISTEYESGDQISLKFSVEDTGIGIPVESFDTLFIPFSQVDGSSSRKNGGSGLGLSFCKKLVDLMGGTLSFESEKGKGSKFWFSLKLLIASPSYLPTSVPAANQFFYPEFKQFIAEESKNVLVVEQNPKLRMSLHSILMSLSYESMESKRIDSAIDSFKMAKKINEPFDIIFISDTSGFIKSLLDLVTTEKVFIYGREENSEWANHPKVTSYLVKPILYSQVISLLLRHHNNLHPLLRQKLIDNDINDGQKNNNNNMKMNIEKLSLNSQQQQQQQQLIQKQQLVVGPKPQSIPIEEFFQQQIHQTSLLLDETLLTTNKSNKTETNDTTTTNVNKQNFRNYINSPSTPTPTPTTTTTTTTTTTPTTPTTTPKTTTISTTSSPIISPSVVPTSPAINPTDRKCILVAEDNDVNIKVIIRQLDKLGYYPVVGCNGNKVLDILNGSEYHPCLILMDCQMPEMDGFECSKIIRGIEPKGQRIPIIAMTANSVAAEDQCRSSGMDDYLAKPVKTDSLSQMLIKWTGGSDNNTNNTNNTNNNNNNNNNSGSPKPQYTFDSLALLHIYQQQQKQQQQQQIQQRHHQNRLSSLIASHQQQTTNNIANGMSPLSLSSSSSSSATTTPSSSSPASPTALTMAPSDSTSSFSFSSDITTPTSTSSTPPILSTSTPSITSATILTPFTKRNTSNNEKVGCNFDPASPLLSPKPQDHVKLKTMTEESENEQ